MCVCLSAEHALKELCSNIGLDDLGVLESASKHFSLCLADSEVRVESRSIPCKGGAEYVICLWAVTFPVFNIKFPLRGPRNLCILLYRSVLDVKGGPPLKPTVIEFLRQLQ